MLYRIRLSFFAKTFIFNLKAKRHIADGTAALDYGGLSSPA